MPDPATDDDGQRQQRQRSRRWQQRQRRWQQRRWIIEYIPSDQHNFAPDNLDPGATHFYGDGCDDDEHGRVVKPDDLDGHYDHLVIHPYDARYLHDPVHHFIAIRPADWHGPGYHEPRKHYHGDGCDDDDHGGAAIYD